MYISCSTSICKLHSKNSWPIYMDFFIKISLVFLWILLCISLSPNATNKKTLIRVTRCINQVTYSTYYTYLKTILLISQSLCDKKHLTLILFLTRPTFWLLRTWRSKLSLNSKALVQISFQHVQLPKKIKTWVAHFFKKTWTLFQ